VKPKSGVGVAATIVFVGISVRVGKGEAVALGVTIPPHDVSRGDITTNNRNALFKESSLNMRISTE